MRIQVIGFIFAHQSNWDEILLVLLPILALLGIVLLARNRINKMGNKMSNKTSLPNENMEKDI